jgi:hypothetical protein
MVYGEAVTTKCANFAKCANAENVNVENANGDCTRKL